MQTRHTEYLGDYVALTRTIHGHLLYVDTRDVSLTPHLLMDGNWEPWVTNVMRNARFQPGETFVDVGANCGWYSLLAAVLGLRVISFDPNRRLCSLMMMTARVNGFGYGTPANWIVHPRAVGASSDVVAFAPQPDNQGGAGIRPCDSGIDRSMICSIEEAEWATAPSPTPAALKQSVVRMTSLDSMLVPGARVDHIKIDVEGSEQAVIQGATRVLEENPHATLSIEHNTGDGELVQSLIARGYELGRFDHSGKVVPCTPAQVERLRPSEMLSFTRPRA